MRSGRQHQFFVDVDTGVDDAIALIYLLASPDAEIGRHRLNRWERRCRPGLREQSRPARPVPRRRRAGIPGRRSSAQFRRARPSARSMAREAWATPTCRRPIDGCDGDDAATAWITCGPRSIRES